MTDLDITLDPQLEEHLRRTLHAVAATTPATTDVVAIARQQRTRIRPITVAAALLAVIGVGTAVVLTRGDTKKPPAASVPAAIVTPAAVTMIPDALPDGFSLVGDIMESTIGPDPIQRRVYARAAAPEDTRSWINLWFSSTQLGATCDGQTEAAAVTIGDVQGATCRFGTQPWHNVVWKIGDVVVLATGSSAVTLDELVAFSQSLVSEPVAVPQSDIPPFNLAPAADATDWVPLVGTDIAAGATIRQTIWTATPTGAPESGNVQVWAMNGAPNEAVYVVQEPVDAERITINGHPAFFETSGEGVAFSVWWTEEDGLTVSVSGTGVLDRAGLIAFAESLHTVDQPGLEAFATAGGVGFIQPGA